MSTVKMDKKSCVPNGRVCGNCLAHEGCASAPNLSACARCGTVLYCSKECQRAHWKANHQQYCVAKANRAPQSQNSSGSHETADSNAASKWEKCAICQDALSDVSACILPCTHVYHASCVAELRKFGVKQACPLCRTPLPPGPEKVFDEATRRYMVLSQLVERGYESWSDLPASSQRELDAVLTGWRAVADQGLAEA